MNNFSTKEVLGNFLVLEKNTNFDFFTPNNLNLIQDYKNNLLNVNLESIPYSEGLYKIHYIINGGNKILVMDENSVSLNKYLQNNNVFSDKAMLLLKNKIILQKYISIVVKSENNLSTTINLKSCPKNYCVIDLSNIPLFYKNRRIKVINYSSNIYGSIVKMNADNMSKLW